MQEPKQGETDQRKQDIGVEDHTRIPWRKVVRFDYLDYVTTCCTQQEAGRATTAAVRMSKLPRNARSPTIAKPRLAKPTSLWNGLGAQPMKRAVASPKKTCSTKL